MYSISIWAVFFLYGYYVTGSELEFTGTPSLFHPLQDDSLTLRCSLLSISAATAVVGRRDVEYKRQTTDHLTSIVIKLDGKDVATLTDGVRVNVHGDHDVPNLAVTGSLSPQGDTVGYLQLQWTNPHQNQTGSFECDVTGLTDTGPFVKNKPTSVQYTQPRVNEIVESLLGLKFAVASSAGGAVASGGSDAGMADLLANLTSQANKIEFLESRYQEQEMELLHLKDQYNKTKSENNDLKAQLSSLNSELLNATAQTNASLVAMATNLSHAQSTADSAYSGVTGLQANISTQQSAMQDLTSVVQHLQQADNVSRVAQGDMAQALNLTDSTLAKLTNNVTDLSGRTSLLTSAQNDLQDQLGNVTSQLPLVTSELARLAHVESGRINCGDSEKWTGVSLSGSQKYNEVAATFDKPYTRPPVVHLARQFINDWEDTNFFNFIVVNNVTTGGFVATCGAAAQNDHVKAMWVSWISVPTDKLYH